MNQEQVISLIRQILLAVGGFVVGKGWVDNETMLQIAGAASILIGSAWALWARSKKQIVASAATKVVISASSQQAAGIEVPLAPK